MTRRFVCARFPEGVAHIRTESGRLVAFRDGYADVDDPEVVEDLLTVPAIFGITELEYGGDSDGTEQDGDKASDESDEDADDEKSSAVEASDGRPVVRASKEEWVTYAVSQGVDQGEAEAMSKQELIDLLKG